MPTTATHFYFMLKELRPLSVSRETTGGSSSSRGSSNLCAALLLVAIMMLHTLKLGSAFSFRQSRLASGTGSVFSCSRSIEHHFGVPCPVVTKRLAVRMFSAVDPETMKDLDSLKEKIQKKGDEIRKLKEDGVEKAQLQPHVDELLALKAQLPEDQQPEQPKKKAPSKQQKPSLSNSKNDKKKPDEMSESELRQTRISKIEAMKDAGVNPFAYTFQTTHTSKELASLYQDKLENGEEDEATNVAIAGRILTRRVFGKLAFFTIQDDSGQIQVQFDKSRLGDSFTVCTLCPLNQFTIRFYSHSSCRESKIGQTTVTS